MRFAHTMIRVKNLEDSINFYTNILGMKVLNTSENAEYKYTLAFLGYGDINDSTALELTYNWGENEYDHGNAFGHLCMAVNDV
jgi:lactoylglutathione lyase